MSSFSCNLCFQSFTPSFKDDTEGNCRIVECCKRLLGEKKNIFPLTFLTVDEPTFCLHCIKSSQKLFFIHKRFVQVKQELDTFIETFSQKISELRLRSSQNEYFDETEKDQPAKDFSIIIGEQSQSDYNKITQSTSELLRSESTICKSQIIDETFKTEILDDFDNHLLSHDQYLEDNFPSSANSNDETKFSGFYTHTVPVAIRKKPANRDLKVSLERLQFDSKGNVIHPILTTQRRKRKATTNTPASMDGENFQEDLLIKNETFRENNEKIDRDRIREDLNWESGKCKWSKMSNSVKMKKKTKIRRHNNLCSICGVVSESYIDHQKHLETHQEGKQDHKCELCGQMFRGPNKLLEHMKKEHLGENPYRCHFCPASFGRRKTLYNHKGHHKIETNVQCNVCHRFYKNEKVLESHMALHNERNKKHCDSCDMKFSIISDLLSHKITVHGLRSPFSCNHCQLNTFTCQKELNHHLKKVHNEKIIPGGRMGPPYICEWCGNSYKSITSVQRHRVRAHGFVKNRKKRISKYVPGCFPCDQCEKSFTKKHLLNEHVKVVHLKVLSYTCHLCGKIVSSSKSFYRHLKTHSDKTHDCPTCGRGFNELYNLRNHIRRLHGKSKDPMTSGLETSQVTNVNEFIENIQPIID